MIARVLADKGVREFVGAARILKREDPRRRFTILGHADVANRTAITRAELDGWVNEGVIEWVAPIDDVRGAIDRSDCVVLPSYREGTSRVLLEGAAMARPLVASDVPGCREVVDDGVSGHLAPVRDAEGLAAAMRRVDLLDDEAWQAMGQAGRRKVIAEFSPETVIDAYLAALARAGVR
jgi:glycosyltransferase involved in cell wall biosynthesis